MRRPGAGAHREDQTAVHLFNPRPTATAQLRPAPGVRPRARPARTRSSVSSTARCTWSRSSTWTSPAGWDGGAHRTVGGADLNWRDTAVLPPLLVGRRDLHPGPSRRPSLDYARSSLTELRGQLCVARMRDDEPNTPGVLELWMSKSAMQPRWDRQYAIPVANTGGHSTLFRWGT
jgi:hypothetical protein